MPPTTLFVNDPHELNSGTRNRIIYGMRRLRHSRIFPATIHDESILMPTHVDVRPTLHALRRNQGLTLSELARLTGISMRRLAEFEYQNCPLEPAAREALVAVFGAQAWTAASGVGSVAPEPESFAHSSHSGWSVARWTVAATATLALSLAMPHPALAMRSAPTTAEVGQQVATPPLKRRWVASAGLNLRTGPGIGTRVLRVLTHNTEVIVRPATRQVGKSVWVKVRVGQREGWVNQHFLTAEQPAPNLAISTNQQRDGQQQAETHASSVKPSEPFETTKEPNSMLPPAAVDQLGRYTCPVVSKRGRIIITQGYGVGTHAPAATWGGIDLAPAGGPAMAEGAIVVAAHAGTVAVAFDTWPAGNHVSVHGPNGWRTGYSHLAAIYVEGGQNVEAGQPLGLVGSTGAAIGPHLHFDAWHNGINVDPTRMVGC